MSDSRVTADQTEVWTGRSEHFVAISACWPIAAPSLILLVNKVVPATGPVSLPLGTLAVYGLFAFAVACSLRVVVRRLTPAVLSVVFVLVLAFTVLIILDQNGADRHLAVATQSLGLAVPWLVVANAIRNRPLFMRYLYVTATVVIVAGVVRLYFPSSQASGFAYSQYAGYQMLPAVIIFADDFLHSRRFRSAALLMLAVMLLLAAGARGPLLAVILYLVVKAAVAVRRRPVVLVGLAVAALVFAQWFTAILPMMLGGLGRVFGSQGWSTRAIDRLIRGDFLEDRTRIALAEHSWDLIRQHPTTGVGLARDRPLLALAMGEHDPELVKGWYSHNIFLELLLQWGVFIGGGLIVVLGALILRAVRRTDDTSTQRIVLIFVGIGLWPLLVSGSYLTSPLFFTLLGFCFAAARQTTATTQRERARLAGAGH